MLLLHFHTPKMEISKHFPILNKILSNSFFELKGRSKLEIKTRNFLKILDPKHSLKNLIIFNHIISKIVDPWIKCKKILPTEYPMQDNINSALKKYKIISINH